MCSLWKSSERTLDHASRSDVRGVPEPDVEEQEESNCRLETVYRASSSFLHGQQSHFPVDCLLRVLHLAAEIDDKHSIFELEQFAQLSCSMLHREQKVSREDLQVAYEKLTRILFGASGRSGCAKDMLNAGIEAKPAANRYPPLAPPPNPGAGNPLDKDSKIATVSSTAYREAPTNENGSTLHEAAPMQRHLQAQLLGRFAVIYEGEALPLSHDKNALAILKYLLAHRFRPVPQDSLIGWLWPDSPPQKARWSLNSAIYSLRRWLSSELPPATSSSYILLEAGHYRLSPDLQVSLDTQEFDARYERGRHLEKSLQTREAAEEYEKAIELYQGDYLNEDLYDGAVDWTTIERERLSEAYMDVLHRLADHYMETGQLRESIVTCYQLLQKDRCHEASYRLLMRCYVRLGLRVRALHQYRLCEQTLSQQYGMDPSPETEALYKSVLRDESI